MSYANDIVIQMLRRLETDAHRRGWDSPATLWLLYNRRDPESDRAYRLAMPARPLVYAGGPSNNSFLMGAYHIGDLLEPAIEVYRMALAAADGTDPMPKLVQAWRTPAFIGMAAVFEAWLIRGDDRMSTRQVFATLADGREFHGIRQHTKRPAFITTTTLTGTVIEALRVITAAVSDLPLPPLTVEPVGWNALRAEQAELVAAGDPRWAQAGITYRQLVYWTISGYLKAVDPRPGVGASRLWPVSELAVATQMVELIRAGLTVRAAAARAREAAVS